MLAPAGILVSAGALVASRWPRLRGRQGGQGLGSPARLALRRRFARAPCFDDTALCPWDALGTLPEQDSVGVQMSQDEEEVREPMDAEDRVVVAASSSMQIDAIDLAVVQEASARWSKVARVLGTFLKKRPGIPEDVPLEFVWERLCRLVAQGDLESQGDISQWGASEVRKVG